MNALGLIEVYSFTTALCVADLMAKAADVKVIAFDRNRPFAPDAPAFTTNRKTRLSLTLSEKATSSTAL
ncbi:MAG: BMC domain-containing protein [Clostridia bacterium]|nr:BMC domain-containing protein [Clostridia bacterium]